MQDERGYTLVIVLLIIVLFLGVASMFIKASIGHAKQEKKIDSSNTAVAAAEMGVEYYSTYLEFETKKVLDEFDKEVSKKIIELQGRAGVIINQVTTGLPQDNSLISLGCGGTLTQDKLQAWINCETELLKISFINEFIDEMGIIYSTISADSPTIVNESTEYRLSNKSKVENYDNIVFDLEIRGKNDSSNKFLNAKLTTHVPSFISGDKKIPIKNDYTDKEVTDFILSPPVANPPNCPPNASDFAGGTCNYIGHNLEDYLNALPNPAGTSLKVDDFCKAVENKDNCNFNSFEGNEGTPLYLSGDMNGGNSNKLSKMNIYSNGKFTIHNFNSTSKNIIVTRSLEMHNGKMENSVIAVLGYDNKSGTINWKKEGNQNLIVGENSKLCINLEGIDLVNSNSFNDSSLQTNGNGKIIFYPSRTDLDKLPAESTANKKVQYISDYLLFLETCSVNLNNIPAEFKLNGSIESDTDIEIDVEYKN